LHLSKRSQFSRPAHRDQGDRKLDNKSLYKRILDIILAEVVDERSLFGRGTREGAAGVGDSLAGWNDGYQEERREVMYV
jgi:hypothetical protein